MRTETASTKPGKTAKPKEETHEEWLLRTSLEAEQESSREGWLSTEQVEESMARHKHEYYKKQAKAA